MRRLALLPLLLVGAVALTPGPRPPAPAIEVSTPLGTIITAPVTLDNFGQASATVSLFEALPAPAQDSTPSEPLRVVVPSAPGPLSLDLLAGLANAPDGQSDMLIYLADQADLSAAAAIPDWNLRGAAVVQALQQTAATTQAPLLTLLHQAGYSTPRSFWIVNALEVKGDRALAEQLARQPGVAVVTANVQHTLATESAQPPPAGAQPITWGLQRVRAPSVWADWGVRGAGVTVANLDTGVAYTHTALLRQYRGWTPNGVSHDYNWYDAAGEKPLQAPADPVGHGTHTMGIMVGGPAGGYSGLGAAPDARWIAVRGCDGSFCSDAALIAGAQWLLAPTNLAGKQPRPDLRPQIINNSWGQAGDTPWYSGYVTAWNAAGIFSAFANGNNGLFGGCQSTITPGSYAQSFAVGATDVNDDAANFSSRGPTSDGRIKPDISAPGVDIPSAWPDGSVRLLSGTSMATPHVAGVVALLWSANPALIGNLTATENILTSTALPRPTTECSQPLMTSPNNVYGWGRLDARAAVQKGRVDLPWLSIPATVALPADGTGQFTVTLDGRQVSGPGTYFARILVMRANLLTSIPVTFTVASASAIATVHGRLTDLWQAGGVYGQVRINAGPVIQTNDAGFYTVTVPYGQYAVTTTASGYFSATTTVAITRPSVVDFVLQPDQPHVEISAPPVSATLAFGQRAEVPITINNAGSQPLSISPTIPPLDWVVDEAGLAAEPLYDLSSAPPISLTDDSIYTAPLQLGFAVPIYGTLVTQLYLSSNGWVSAFQPGSAQPFASCLPAGSLPPATLAPFWADLDPGVGGVVRFGHIDAHTFVISFEKVPPWRATPDPSGPTYSFQLVLHADGYVEFVYGAMGALPERWSTGVSFDAERGQPLACYISDPILPGTQWRLRNQPNSALWLAASPIALNIPPGGTATLQAVLSGYGFAPWHLDPFVGTVRLLTNDPGRSNIDLSAQASVGPPADQLVLPIISR